MSDARTSDVLRKLVVFPLRWLTTRGGDGLGRYKDASHTRCPSMNCQKRAHLQQGVFIRRVSCYASLVVTMGFGRRKSGKEKGIVQDALCEVFLSLTSKRAEEASPRRCVYLRWTGAFAMIYIEPASEQ